MRPLRVLSLPAALLLLGFGGGVTAQRPRRDPLPPLRAEQTALLVRVDSLRLQRRPQEAIALITPAIDAARDEGDSTYLLQLLLRLGQERVSYGAGAAGEAPLREALRMAERRPDPRARLRALRWLGVAALNQGRLDEARLHADSLLRAAQAEQDLYYEAWARIGIGWDHDTRGRQAEAIDQYERAIRSLGEVRDAWSEAWAWNSLGIALGHAGRYPESMASYQRAAELAGSVDYALVEAMARNNLGTLAYSLGDPGQAQAEFRRARQIHLRVGNPREAAFPAINEAFCLFELGREDRSIALLDSLLEMARTGGYADLRGRVLVERAELSARRERPREAISFYREALALGSDLPNKNRLEASSGLAELLARGDSLAAAVALLRRALAESVMPRGSESRLLAEQALGRLELVVAREDQAAIEAGMDRLLAAARTADSLGLQGFRVQPLSEAARAAQALGRQADARRWLEAAAVAWEAERSAPLDPEWREVRGAAGRAIYTELADLLLAEGPAVAFGRLQRFKARTLSERLRGPGLGLPVPAAAPAPLAGSGPDSMAGLALDRFRHETLRPGELFLDLYAGPRVSLLFAVTRDSLRAVRLPGEEALRGPLKSLRELMATLPQPGAGESGRTVLDAARPLEQRLLGEVRDLTAAASRVLISPDGIFHLMPWEADSTLLWSRVPSAALLADLRAVPPVDLPGPPGKASPGIRFVLARGASNEPPTAGARAEVRWLKRALRGGHEIRRIERRLPTSADSAAPAIARAGLAPAFRPEDRVLHVAGHVTVSDQSPWQSEIRFGMEPQDRLRAVDLAEERLPARLIVLSGCSSAGGRALSGEGVAGLASAGLAAGAHAVVATLWPVEDAAAARFVAAFYRELAVGRSVDEAMAAARAVLRRDPATGHPFYWASFVTVGDGAETVPIRLRSKWLIPALVAGGSAVLALLLFGWRRGE